VEILVAADKGFLAVVDQRIEIGDTEIFRKFGDTRFHGRDRFGHEFIVIVQIRDPIALRRLDALVARRIHTAVFLAMDHTHRRMRSDESIQKRFCAVDTAIIHDNDFIRRNGLIQGAFQTTFKQVPPVFGRDHDRDRDRLSGGHNVARRRDW